MVNFNLDISKKVVIDTTNKTNKSLSKNGITKVILEGELENSEQTSSIIEYSPNTQLQIWSHPFGEEIFVLEGIFSNKNGDYPAGTYIRNSSMISDKSFSKKGCKIFIKSNQTNSIDNTQIVIDTNISKWLKGYGNLEVIPLYENTALVKWPKSEKFVQHSHYGGEEIFVLKGEFIDEHGRYPKGTWLRSPHLSTHFPFVEEETIIFVKTGHLFP